MSDESNKPQLFNDNSGALVAQNDAAAVARAIQEIQAALVIAQRFPRDEVKVKARILEACKRKELAEVSEYEYSRGGTRITGPTIDLLRAIANRWGNMRFGWEEKVREEGRSSIRCFAWDLQTNGQAERTFMVRHWRDTQGGGYELKDERDIYEAMANQAARRVRACLEEVIDSDIVSAAIDQCRLTLRSGEKVPLADRAVQMVAAFSEFGVTQAMIETRIGNKLDAVSENQLASLRRVFKSIKDGVGKREDYFKPETAKPEFEGGKSAAVSAHSATAAQSDPSGTSVQQGAVGATPVASAPSKQSGFNPLKALRGLCASANVSEGDLLGYLSATGTTDGSHGTLDELSMAAPKVLELVAEQWGKISAEILAAKKGSK